MAIWPFLSESERRMRYKRRQERKERKYELKYGYKTAKKEEKTERTALRQSARVATAGERSQTMQAGFGAASNVVGSILGQPQAAPAGNPMLLLGGLMAVGLIVVVAGQSDKPSGQQQQQPLY